MGIELTKPGKISKPIDDKVKFVCDKCEAEFTATRDCCRIERCIGGRIFCECPYCGNVVSKINLR